MKSKKPRGRPKFADKTLRKDVLLLVRVTRAEKAGLVREAVKKGQKLSEYVRKALLGG